MSCYHPLPAYVDRLKGGAPKIGAPARRGAMDFLELPCGRCVGCRWERARQWSIRIGHEAQLHRSNQFVTLDYSPKHLPGSLSLEYSDYQGFMRRLRKELGRVRFFVAGEYGSQYRRPHWHAILFGCDLPDRVKYLNDTFRSETIERIWGKGHAVIGDVTPESAAYVAGYTLEKRYGAAAEDHYEDVVDVQTGEVTARRPEFVRMSLKPGIGAEWFERFGRDLFPHDFAVQSGKKYKVPSYYWRRYQERAAGDLVEAVSHERYQRARVVDPHENSEERRLVRETVHKARLETFSKRGH